MVINIIYIYIYSSTGYKVKREVRYAPSILHKRSRIKVVNVSWDTPRSYTTTLMGMISSYDLILI